jgi:hypothetical protein
MVHPPGLGGNSQFPVCYRRRRGRVRNGPGTATRAAAVPSPAAGSLAGMRLTVFWERMRAQFGEQYAESVAKDQVLTALGGRTVNQALADGEDAKTVWRAVCEAFDVPERLR